MEILFSKLGEALGMLTERNQLTIWCHAFVYFVPAVVLLSLPAPFDSLKLPKSWQITGHSLKTTTNIASEVVLDNNIE